MSRIKELLTQIDQASEMANQELLSFPLEIRVGMEGHIRSAQDKLPKLEDEYMSEVIKNIVIIPVVGTKAEEFISVASKEYSVLAVNYYLASDSAAKGVIDRRHDDYYSSTAYNASLDEVYKLKTKYKIARTPYMESLGAEYYGKPLVDSFRTQFTKAYGNELFSAVIRGEIGKYALNNRFTGQKMEVLLYNYDPNLGLSEYFLPQPVPSFAVNENKKITKESVFDMLTKLKNKFTNKTETTIEE